MFSCLNLEENKNATVGLHPACLAQETSRTLNFNFDILPHTIVTCQGVFVPISALSDHFWTLTPLIITLQVAICSFSFKQNRHRLVLTLCAWYWPNIFDVTTGFSFEAITFPSLFDRCVSFMWFWWSIFL